ncbi:hypothetical protein M3Y99_01316200 [Aphelenchoides fujianensis]|nr:hypothetical protein M3Y99_01316200 [Aphelenchoides fujianensis]
MATDAGVGRERAQWLSFCSSSSSVLPTDSRPHKSSLSPLQLPLAPYNVKIYCRNGVANGSESLGTGLCPSASTSCGFFQFATAKRPEETVGVYECVDSSIFLSEEREESGPGRGPRCHRLLLHRLNRQFLRYLTETYELDIEKTATTYFRFCCALSHATLQRLIASGRDALESTSSPVDCAGQECLSGAVGCLSHDRVKAVQTSKDYDYRDIKPVEIYERGEATVVAPEFSISAFEEKEAPNHLHCVYSHFNDELYRYCLLIYAQKSTDFCYTAGVHRICCCFVTPTTLPPSTTTTELPTTQPPTHEVARRRPSHHHHPKRTKCRIVYIQESTWAASRKGYTPKPRKEIICEKAEVVDERSGAMSKTGSLSLLQLLLLNISDILNAQRSEWN